jgi:hypothetical protein
LGIGGVYGTRHRPLGLRCRVPAIAAPTFVSRVAADPAVRRALLIVVVLRVGLGLAAWVGLMVAGPAVIPGRPLPEPAGGLGAALVDPWQRWDSWHFEAIATGGYPRGSLDVAFLPLYPLLMRATLPLAGGSAAVGGMLVSTLAAVAGLVLVHRRVAADLGEAIAGRTVLFLGLAPTAMFLIAPYTEALFLSLSAGAFVAMRSRRWTICGGLIAAAALTRPQGLLLLLPAAVECLPEVFAGWRRRRLGIRPAHLLLGLVPLLAFAAWVGWTARVVGVTPFGAEELGWGGHPAWPWQGLVDGLGSTGAYPGPLYNAVTVAAWLALTGVLVRRRDRVPASYTAYAAVSLVPIVFREEGFGNPWASAPRFALVVFPLFVSLALLTERRPRLAIFVAVVSAGLAVLSVVVFSHNQFVA